jgi:hypothetical protein
MKPIYTLDNTTPAFQLNWSVSLFGRVPFPPSCDWLEQLHTATEADGVRILEFHSTQSNVMIIRAAAKHDWRLSRIGLLSNHIHVLLGAGVRESPAEVALSLMNNLAYAPGMTPAFRFRYYVGTFGPYDRHAVRRRARR